MDTDANVLVLTSARGTSLSHTWEVV
jgi:hypothetical protein